jgi:hypothetical protein
MVPTPTINGVSPTTSCPGGQLTIAGQGFGAPRSAVDGTVIIGGVGVSEYLAWSDSGIVVLVPKTAPIVPAADLYVSTSGGFPKTTIAIVAAPC